FLGVCCLLLQVVRSGVCGWCHLPGRVSWGWLLLGGTLVATKFPCHLLGASDCCDWACSVVVGAHCWAPGQRAAFLGWLVVGCGPPVGCPPVWGRAGVGSSVA